MRARWIFVGFLVAGLMGLACDFTSGNAFCLDAGISVDASIPDGGTVEVVDPASCIPVGTIGIPGTGGTGMGTTSSTGSGFSASSSGTFSASSSGTFASSSAVSSSGVSLTTGSGAGSGF